MQVLRVSIVEPRARLTSALATGVVASRNAVDSRDAADA
jgi:hypothetical protein